MSLDCNVYIVMTQTGTRVSKLLKLYTKAEYNHCSLSVYRDLHEMYSFGRKYTFTPFPGGYIMEAPDRGLYRIFQETDVCILELAATAEQRDYVAEVMENMYRQRGVFGYDFVGVFLAAFGLRFERYNRLYCSEFVRRLLVQSGICSQSEFPKITQPADFLNLKNAHVIYTGKLQAFAGY